MTLQLSEQLIANLTVDDYQLLLFRTKCIIHHHLTASCLVSPLLGTLGVVIMRIS